MSKSPAELRAFDHNGPRFSHTCSDARRTSPDVEIARSRPILARCRPCLGRCCWFAEEDVACHAVSLPPASAGIQRQGAPDNSQGPRYDSPTSCTSASGLALIISLSLSLFLFTRLVAASHRPPSLKEDRPSFRPVAPRRLCTAGALGPEKLTSGTCPHCRFPRMARPFHNWQNAFIA